jgi:hypothetical protein
MRVSVKKFVSPQTQRSKRDHCSTFGELQAPSVARIEFKSSIKKFELPPVGATKDILDTIQCTMKTPKISISGDYLL